MSTKRQSEEAPARPVMTYVRESVRTWALAEAADIERGFVSASSKVTAADVYESSLTGVPAATIASNYADRINASLTAMAEQRWENAVTTCEKWGLVL